MSAIANAVSIGFIEVPSLIWAWWSFKMNQNAFGATPGETESQMKYAQNELLKHSGSGIMGTGVCHWVNSGVGSLFFGLC